MKELREIVLCAEIKSVSKIKKDSEYFAQMGPEFTYYCKRREAEINLLLRYKRLAPKLRKIIQEVGIRVFEQVDVGDNYEESIKNPLNGFKKSHEVKLTVRADDKFVKTLQNAHTLLINESFWDIEPELGYALVRNLEAELIN